MGRFESYKFLVIDSRLESDSLLDGFFTHLATSGQEHDHLHLLGVLKGEHILGCGQAFLLGLVFIFEGILNVINVLFSSHKLERCYSWLRVVLESGYIDKAITLTTLDVQGEVNVGVKVCVFEDLKLPDLLGNDMGQLLIQFESNLSFLADSSMKLVPSHCCELILVVRISQ